ncbi:hypothetical protein [Kitasatospora sp. NPDC057223]|uniref:hypothetical protein n=1 Tax=Kitasatospora sp. NPDC057223 TaxID=3346055 RepID=UPI003633BFFF
MTPVGTLTAGGVPVPLRVCGWCLDHLEAWHHAESARSATGRLLDRARAIADVLALAGGTAVRLHRTPSGYRLTAESPRDPQRQLALLPGLRLADRFGHSSRERIVWADVDEQGLSARPAG